MCPTFEFDGEKYKKASRHQKEWGSSLIGELSLKDGGHLLWDFAGDGNCSNFFDVIRKEMESEEYGQYFKEFEWPWYMPSREEYAKTVAASGFSSCSITEVNRDRFFSDADEMIRWIDQPSIVPFIKVLPEGAKEKFRDEVVRAMLERALQADGTCFETFRRIHVRADK